MFANLGGHKPSKTGWTLVELMLAIAVLGVLAAIALPAYSNYRDRINRATAIQDIRILQVLITDYASDSGIYPMTLADVGNGSKLDPWGHTYYYLNLSAQKGNGGSRKDHSLNPINTDFDLFSAGKNGVFKTQLTQKDSLDDIVRARDGAFVGLASDFTR
ncbi:MAG: type II secretion system protein [Herbaspirillum sp.]